MPKWVEIIIHNSATSDGPELNWNAIRRYHIDHNKWLDIGYHSGVELVGTTYEVLMGRPTYMAGAHTIGHNTTGLGICFVGDFSESVPPDGQLLAGARKIKEWMLTYDIAKEHISPHRKFNSTDCPGTMFDWEKLMELVEKA